MKDQSELATNRPTRVLELLEHTALVPIGHAERISDKEQSLTLPYNQHAKSYTREGNVHLFCQVKCCITESIVLNLELENAIHVWNLELCEIQSLHHKTNGK